MTRRLLLILTMVSLVSSCGFALRGNFDLPDSLDKMSVNGPDLELNQQIEDALEVAGVEIAEDDDETAATFVFSVADFEREVRTTNAQGLATIYDLKYRVAYDVRDAEGEELQVNQTLTQTRVFDYDPLQELQSDEEEEFLREEMRDELVLQVLRRLSRL